MNRILHFLLLFSLFPLLSSAQVGTWRNYLSYADIQQICSSGDVLFVRASNGLYQYNQKDQSITTYDRVNGLSDTYITHIAWNPAAKRLIAVYQNSNIDLIDLDGNITNISALYAKTMTDDKTVNSIRIDGVYAWLICGFGIVKVNMQKAEISETYTPNNPEYPTSLPDYDENKDYPEYISLVSTLSPGGPESNYFGFLKYENDRLFTCSGGTTSVDVPAAVQIFSDGEWTICQDEGISQQTGVAYNNTTCLDYDPADPNHLFVGARSGLYEFRNAKFVNYYNYQNSPIERFDGQSIDYEMVTATKYDAKGSLWLFNSQAPTQSLIEYTPKGKFISHEIPEVMTLDDAGYDNKSMGNLMNITFNSKGYMWFVNNHHIDTSLFRHDLTTNTTTKYANFVNQDGTAITAMYAVSCVAEDKDGNMWIGTDVGPFVLEKAQIEATNPVYTQVKVPRNDGSNYADYLLNKVNITAICIDAGNRKWIATNGDGVYLISADNLTQIHHFTKENSKLLSNTVQSMALNNQTGEVFFGTENGLCSYISDATQVNDEMTKDNVWAYPNPVTPDYTGLITIVGLSYNADVKIVSTNGALITEGRSNGGMFTWDGNDRQGRRVASGVYMVITATSDGKKGTVCKIAVIK